MWGFEALGDRMPLDVLRQGKVLCRARRLHQGMLGHGLHGGERLLKISKVLIEVCTVKGILDML